MCIELNYHIYTTKFTVYFNFKIIESAGLTHFYVKGVSLYQPTSYKTNDVIKCVNEYAFRNVAIGNTHGKPSVYQFRINSQGMGLETPSSDNSDTAPLTEGVWAYLGSIPTSEIRKK